MSELSNTEELKNIVDEVSITEDQYDHIMNLQNHILSMIASREKTSIVLEKLCEMAESLLPNSVASIMLVNNTSGLMSVLCAPSVPQVGHDALCDLKPGPTGGSCGNAVFHNEAQYVTNTFTDSRWEDLRQVAVDFNLCSCWSMPVRNKNKQSIGTFALSSFEHRSPSNFHKKLLEVASSIVNIVLQNRENEERIKLLSTSMQNASEGMIITDANNNIIEVNSAFEKIYGYKEEEIIGKNPRILSAKQNSPEFYKQMWENIQQTSKWSGEIINKTADGKEILQWLSISNIHFENDLNTNNYLAVFTDLTELKQAQELLKKTAFTDALTSLPNKVKLEEILSLKEEQTLLLVNVNNFSYINTAYGLDIGDALLKKLAVIFKDDFSQKRTFRINSDEYALLYDGEIDINNEVDLIKTFFKNNQIELDGIKLNVSFSFGAAIGVKKLLRNAASALKISKQSGRNNLYVFDKNKAKKKDRKKFIQANNLLFQALANDGVVPYYQGIRNNKTKKIEKFEVLARINDNGKVISPFAFLQEAKLSGVLPEITKVMIDKSFKEMSRNKYTFSINITEDDLNAEYLCNYLEEKSAEYSIKPKRVILEILEGISSDGKSENIHQLKKLKSLGFLLAIDDFGSEYSNFERVLELDIDFLKIDARYIKDIDTNEKSYEVTKAIAFFAKNVNIPCIAEFVHKNKVQALVNELGIEFSQGFYFSKPQDKPIE